MVRAAGGFRELAFEGSYHTDLRLFFTRAEKSQPSSCPPFRTSSLVLLLL